MCLLIGFTLPKSKLSHVFVDGVVLQLGAKCLLNEVRLTDTRR